MLCARCFTYIFYFVHTVTSFVIVTSDIKDVDGAIQHGRGPLGILNEWSGFTAANTANLKEVTMSPFYYTFHKMEAQLTLA